LRQPANSGGEVRWAKTDFPLGRNDNAFGGIQFCTLAYPWGDPHIAGFEDAVAQVNDIGARSPSFVWRLPDDDMDAAQNDPQSALADRPNTASTLSVWEDPASLYHFLTRTLHARITKGAPDWFVPGDSGHFVCWWIPEGSWPTVAEGMERWHALQQQGATEVTFRALQSKALAMRGLAPTQ
jgi:hypothetical protein